MIERTRCMKILQVFDILFALLAVFFICVPTSARSSSKNSASLTFFLRVLAMKENVR